MTSSARVRAPSFCDADRRSPLRRLEWPSGDRTRYAHPGIDLRADVDFFRPEKRPVRIGPDVKSETHTPASLGYYYAKKEGAPSANVNQNSIVWPP
jgi:hypothetical protein